MQRNTSWNRVASILLCILSFSAVAQNQPSDAAKAERAAAGEAAEKAMIKGPQEVALRDQAKLKLPEGYGFIPTTEAARFMRAIGNRVGDDFIGLVLPLEGNQFLVTVNYHNEGYIKDDEEIKADELLQNIKDGTEEGNKHREEMGVPPMQVTRWIEPPKYDASVHHLVWSIEAKLKHGDDPDPTVNYNTYILGREGYISMDLITSSSTIETDKQTSAVLLAATEFNNGKRYADFNSSTDKIAAYGLAALVGGVALKKLGLLAVIGAFVLKFAKVIFIAVAAFGGGLWNKLRGKKDEPQPVAAEKPSAFTPQLPSSTSSTSSTSSDDKPS